MPEIFEELFGTTGKASVKSAALELQPKSMAEPERELSAKRVFADAVRVLAKMSGVDWTRREPDFCANSVA